MTSQRMQHKVTGQHIEAGYKGMYRFAKQVWEETHDYNEVSRRVAIGIAAATRDSAVRRGDAATTSRTESNHGNGESVRESERPAEGVRSEQCES